MAKKKQSKVVQMLSPENYIRQKARTLPVYKCFVNTDWQETLHGLGFQTAAMALRDDSLRIDDARLRAVPRLAGASRHVPKAAWRWIAKR